MSVFVRAAKMDKAIARAVVRNTYARVERVAEALTWGADEQVCALRRRSGGFTVAALQRSPRPSFRT
jgi:hypothetical protein